MEWKKELKQLGFTPRPEQFPAQRGMWSSGTMSEDFATAIVNAMKKRG